MALYKITFSNELYHHGILGQKWGVRRYQNPDGSLTDEGRKMQRYRRRMNKYYESTKDVNSIFSSLSNEQRKLVYGDDYDGKSQWIGNENGFAELTNLGMRYVQYANDIPVSFIEVWDNGTDVGEVAIATRSDYQGKGYASRGAKYATEWFDKYGSKTLKELRWDALSENQGSISTAEKAGFVTVDESDPSYTDARGVSRHVYRKKKK